MSQNDLLYRNWLSSLRAACSDVKSFCSGRYHLRWCVIQGMLIWVIRVKLFGEALDSFSVSACALQVFCSFLSTLHTYEPYVPVALLQSLLFIVIHPVGIDRNRHTLLQTRWLISLLDNGNIQVQLVPAVYLIAHNTNHS